MIQLSQTYIRFTEQIQELTLFYKEAISYPYGHKTGFVQLGSPRLSTSGTLYTTSQAPENYTRLFSNAQPSAQANGASYALSFFAYLRPYPGGGLQMINAATNKGGSIVLRYAAIDNYFLPFREDINYDLQGTFYLLEVSNNTGGNYIQKAINFTIARSALPSKVTGITVPEPIDPFNPIIPTALLSVDDKTQFANAKAKLDGLYALKEYYKKNISRQVHALNQQISLLSIQANNFYQSNQYESGNQVADLITGVQATIKRKTSVLTNIDQLFAQLNTIKKQADETQNRLAENYKMKSRQSVIAPSELKNQTTLISNSTTMSTSWFSNAAELLTQLTVNKIACRAMLAT